MYVSATAEALSIRCPVCKRFFFIIDPVDDSGAICPICGAALDVGFNPDKDEWDVWEARESASYESDIEPPIESGAFVVSNPFTKVIKELVWLGNDGTIHVAPKFAEAMAQAMAENTPNDIVTLSTLTTTAKTIINDLHGEEE